MCKGTKKKMSETPMLNQACETLVRAKNPVQPFWYTENKALYRKTF